MRGSSSLPHLPPVKTNASSPFSTTIILDSPQSRRQNAASDSEPHTNSSHASPQRSSSVWANKFQNQSRSEFVRGSVNPLLERFEDTALYRNPQRKSLQTVLNDINTKSGSDTKLKFAPKDAKLSLLRKQASSLMDIRRQHRQDSIASVTNAMIKQNCHKQVEVSALEPPPKVVPTRFLFDGTRFQRGSRCDYCNLTGGELECATCNVVAHARCYLSAYNREDKKTKLTFVVPTTNSSWLCSHCQSDLTVEYDERSAELRAIHLTAQRQVLANALTAYVRMMKDANSFAIKKAAIIRIQAMLRGRQARQNFERLQRIRLKPYAVDSLSITIIPDAENRLGLGVSCSSSMEELRLGNGFSCNPFLYVTVVAGNDEDTQLFCFETSVRKPAALSGSIGAELDIVWPEKMFVPGADGNATFCFTLLSKNGPNTFFLGQAVLRLLDTGEYWRTGVVTELELQDHVEIFPKTAQHQPLSLADAGGNAPRLADEIHDDITDITDTGRPRWLVNVHLRPFGEQHSHCGYLNMKSTLESFHSSARWCVLADGILRIYRHFGVTLASDVVDMAHATDVRVVPITSSVHRVKNSTSSTENGLKAQPQAGQSCLAIHHLSRLYLFQCEHKELREWLKKLQSAQKFTSRCENDSTTTQK
ncbi:hypothetical protein V7S43_018065 [Phytophthora oleae]|uniref:PH domain-containing protein n=1 Tax=Phytophthora oleae TaxID=2107226 RepID=A0ABD3ES58_9STRA